MRRSAAHRVVGWLGRQWLVHAPTERGKSFVLRAVFPRLAPEAADFVVAAPGGGKVRARLTESTGYALLHGLDVEGAETAWAVDRAVSGSLVVDAGANVGLFTVPVAHAVGADGRVLAFEPVPATVERLRANVRLNGLENVVVQQAAIGDASGEVELHVAEDPAYSGLSSDPRSPTVRLERVPMVTIDGVWRGLQEPDVSLVKLDVEGAELRALAGATELLRRCRPALMIEASTPEQYASVAAWLGGRGYLERTPDGFRPYNHVFEPVGDVTSAGPAAPPDAT